MSRAAVLIATILVAAATARADPQAADRAAAEADALARAKDFRGAAAKFREAYAADPRPDFMCNVGVAYHKAQELPRAQLFLSRCLERGSALDGKFIDLVRATLAKLEASLKAGSYTPVDVVVEPRFATVSIDAFASDETFDGGRTVWLAFATYHVTVRADGYQPRTVEVTAKDRAMLPLRIALERRSREDQDDRRAREAREREAVVEPPRDRDAGVKPAQPGGDTTGRPAGPVDRPTPPPAAPQRPSMVPAIAASAGVVVIAALALYAHGQAADHADQARFALHQSAYDSEADSVRTWNTVFGVGLVGAGAGALASGYLWFRVLRAPSRTVAPRVEVTGERASITLGGVF